MKDFISIKSKIGQRIVNKRHIVSFKKLGKTKIELNLTNETVILDFASEDQRDNEFSWLAQN